MSVVDPALQPLIDRVNDARRAGAQLDIRGGDSKRFYGEAPAGEPFDVRGLAGISSYEPSELVVSARCGTPLSELEATLAEQGQCLPFEPPHFGPGATVGGMVAAGLAGPSRASVGALRDYVLGATLLNGRAEIVSFGGQVMKNVAGYDVSRLLAGSLGTLGVICEVSLKVLPIAPATATLRFSMQQQEALDALHEWGGQPLPVNASAWWDDMLIVRLRGALAAVKSAMLRMGGEVVEVTGAQAFWHGAREHTDEFFLHARRAVDSGAATLWRLSVPQTTPPLPVSGEQLIEWGGAQRWICTAAPASVLRQVAERVGGHATLFRGRDKSPGVFSALRSPLDRIHRDLKRAFDPDGVFNPGRLYPGL
jgi:glycolate oxidase FAD binding subunit